MINESLEELKPIETFNKEVFFGNEEFSQELCNFILALSVIWNDLKNLFIYFEYVKSLQPKDDIFDKPEEMPVTTKWGEISGIKNFIEKSVVAIIHELFKLIRESKDVIESKMYKNILRQIRKSSRESWFIIEQYAFNRADSKTDLGKALLMIRHKISNHYDKDELFKGYKRKFESKSFIPFISRGNNMLEQRFYFADAIAQEYYTFQQEKVSIQEFYANLNLIKDCINLAIKNIVETFIQKRSAWKRI